MHSCNTVVWQREVIQLVDCRQSHGHSDDVMSAAFCPPNLLATSSYDGEVIIWNVVSGHILCRLHSPVKSDDDDSPGQSNSNHLYIHTARSLLVNTPTCSLICVNFERQTVPLFTQCDFS